MKNLLFSLVFLPFAIFGANKIPSQINAVTVYLNSAEISRLSKFDIKQGTSELIFTGLSSKIDESSIQIAGLQSVSILSIAYDLNYLDKTILTSETENMTNLIEAIELEIALLKNKILGLNEEEQVITTNRLLRSETQVFDLDKIKEVLNK
mgnify:CR=1 FL=1